jgi:hypothetical protein
VIQYFTLEAVNLPARVSYKVAEVEGLSATRVTTQNLKKENLLLLIGG